MQNLPMGYSPPEECEMPNWEATLNSFSLKDLLTDQTKVADKKEQIIFEATKVFIDNGYYKTKMEMIAQKVGIGKSTIYEYFSSKQELFYEAIFYVHKHFYQDLRCSLEKEKDPKKQLKMVIVAYLLFCKVLSRQTEIMEHMDEVPGDIKKELLSFLQQSYSLLEGVLQKGIEEKKFRPCNVPLMSKILTGMLLSSHIHFLEGQESLQDMMDEMLQFIEKGIVQA